MYKRRRRECDKKWESSAFGEIRKGCRCARYIFWGNYRDVWQWSVNKTTVIRFSHMLGWKMPPLVSHTVSIFLYFTRVFNDKWVRGGTVSLSLKRSIVPIRLVDYLHHSVTADGFLESFTVPHTFVPASFPFTTLSVLHFCLVFVSMCVWMCADSPLVRRRGLSCHRRPLRWSSRIPPFSRGLTVTFLHPGQHSLVLSLCCGGRGQRLRKLLPVNVSTSSSRTDC